MKAALCVLALLVGCENMPTREPVKVAVTTSCVTTIPEKPTRLTPCATTIGAVQCFKNLEIDVETLDSTVDQLLRLLVACK